MNRVILPLPLMLILFAVLLVGPLLAQQTSGTILGTVTDQSGGVLVGASVAVKNASTGVSRTVVTGENGGFLVPLLPPALYEVRVTASGFKEAVFENVLLKVDQERRVDIRMELGELSEKVTVQAETVALGTESPSIGEIIAKDQVVQMPLNGRSFVQLATLSAGVTPMDNVQNISQTAAVSGGRRTAVSISGQREYNTDFRFDGIPSKEREYGPVAMQYNVDGIEEFNVQRGYAPADVGLSGRINVVTKSGSNSFHGSAFEFLRNEVLDARNFFESKLLPLRQNQFGAAAGGPILKNRLFFFGNYEGTRRRRSFPVVARVPSDAWLQGNFSDVSTPIKDPTSGQVFSGNIIPRSRFSRFAQTYTPYLPKANAQGTFNLNRSSRTLQDDNQYSGRIDYNLTEKDALFGRFTWMNSYQLREGITAESGAETPLNARNAVLSWTHTFTPRLIQNAKVGLNRVLALSTPPNALSNPDFQQAFGLQNVTRTAICNGLPYLTMTGIDPIGPNPNCTPFVNNDIHYIYNLSYSRGRHTINAGAEFVSTFLRQLFSSAGNGRFDFTGEHSGHAVADFLLGAAQTAYGEALDSVPDRRSVFQSYFIDDKFNLTNKLTMTLGLRYDYFPPFDEDLQKLSTFDHLNPSGGFLFPPGCMYRGRPCSDLGRTGPTGLMTPDKNNWAPRLGLAYNPWQDTAIRASFGLFYQAITGDELSFQTANPPFATASNLVGEPSRPVYLDTTLLFPPPPIVLRGPGLPAFGVNPGGRTGYLQTWTLSVQHKLPGDVFLEGAYIGSKGTHLDIRDDINIPSTPPPPGFTGDLQSRRPWPDFNFVLQSDQVGNSWYHGLQLTAKRTTTSGLSVLANYTFSKSIDEGSFEGQGRSYIPGVHSKARSTFDIRHRLSFSWIYDLPSATAFSNSAAKLMLGGWQLTGITTLQSGFPFNPRTAVDYSRRLARFGRPPNRICDGNISDRKPERWFDTSCFTAPPLFTLGNSGFFILDTDGVINQDLGLHKNFVIRESFQAQFRAEFFNLFNHPNFATPQASFESPTFGRVSRALDARIIQFGLRFLW